MLISRRHGIYINLRHARAHVIKPYTTTPALKATNFAPISARTSPLGVSLLDIDEAETAKAKFNDISEFKTKIKINYLYNAIMNNENAVTIKSLNDFMNKTQALFLSDVNLHLYLTGISLYLTKLASEKDFISVSILELRQIVDSFARFLSIFTATKNKKIVQTLDPDVVKEINLLVDLCREKLLISLTYSYRTTSSSISNKSFTSSVLRFLRSLPEKLRFDPSQFVYSFEEKAAQEVYREIFNISENPKEIANVAANIPPPNLTSIEPYLNDGFATFSSLCDYIEGSRYTEYDENGQLKPMFQIHQELETEEQKCDFMSKYLAFNEYRQLNVEKYCECLLNETTVNPKFQLPGLFNQKFSDLVYAWHQTTVAQFHQLASKLSAFAPESIYELTDDEKVIFSHAAHFKMVPKEILANLIFSCLISSTVTSSSGHVTLLSLAQSLRKKFDAIITRYQQQSPVSELVHKFFTVEDKITFFSSLVSIAIQNCRIDRERIEKALFLQSLQFIDEKTIDMQFTETTNDTYPGFIHGVVRSQSRGVGVIKLHPYLHEVVKQFDSVFTTDSIYLPMLSPPKRWINHYNGGYLMDLKDMVTHPHYLVMRHYFNQANDSGQLRSIYQSLTVLGDTKWAVNGKVFETLQEVAEYDDGFLKIPPTLAHLQVDLAAKPKIEDYDNGEEYKKACFRANYTNKERLTDFYDVKSQRVQFNMTLNVARSLNKNGDVLFLPHQLDFRGRAYPATSCLNHHGEDYVRALLMFWEAKPLGSQGFAWLKYQLAGVYGYDKLDMAQRLVFVENHLLEIIDSAKTPLNGNMWWTKAEKPWQTLALCHEIYDVIRYIEAGGDVSEYPSRIPVHQDGSCNGLQHYAALGLDAAGAKVVNLLPGNRMDIYSVVLNLVKESVEEDAGSEVAQLALKVLSRKMVKQTVMTSVYGVTHYGAKEQVLNRIKELVKDANVQLKAGNPITGLDAETLKTVEANKSSLAGFISTRILHSIDSLFPNAKLLQLWLTTNCLRVVTSFKKGSSSVLQKGQKGTKFLQLHPYQSMMWTSMSGFPVVQLYRHFKSTSVKTTLQDISIIKPYKFTTVDIRRQLNGVAPNFIHSIDATHLLMTSIAATRNEILFASVHDSFWTHPSEVPKLSELIREEFVRLHNSDNIENLRLNLRFLGKDLLQVVWVNNADNPDFVYHLNQERAKTVKIPNHTHWSKCLFKELDEPGPIIQLYNHWKPKVYYKPSVTGKTGYLYSEIPEDTKHSVQLHYKTHTPILVPICFLESPPTGTLDISQVLNSEFFFS